MVVSLGETGRGVTQMVKNPSAMWETWVQSLGWEDPPGKGSTTHCSILAWRIPMDRGAWQAKVHGVTESDTMQWLSTTQQQPGEQGSETWGMEESRVALILCGVNRVCVWSSVTCGCPSGALYVQNPGWDLWITQSEPFGSWSIKKDTLL